MKSPRREFVTDMFFKHQGERAIRDFNAGVGVVPEAKIMHKSLNTRITFVLKVVLTKLEAP